jgi:signal transduction histidine kinase
LGIELIRTAVIVAFLGLAIVVFWHWRRDRSPATLWASLMFAVLGSGLVASTLTPPDPTGLDLVVSRLAGIAIVVLPYLLFRFSTSLSPVTRRTHAFAALVSGVAVLATAVVQHPPSGAPRPGWYQLYLIGILGVWTGLSAWVVWRLARSGQGKPTVAQRRMWTLALGAGTLNGALLFAVLSPTTNSVAYLLALGSAGLFFLGLSPPRAVRSMWRRDDEDRLRKAQWDLMAATTRAEVVNSMLPYARKQLGGESAIFVDRDGSVVSDTPGRRVDDLRDVALSSHADAGGLDVHDDTVVLTLREGRLAMVISPYMPLFGQDELEVLESFGILVDLALSRVALYEDERRARAQAQATRTELEELLYGISHDLRSPIVSVLGYVDCLAEDYGEELGDEGRHFLDRLHSNTAYMDQLISDLLELSRAGRVQEGEEAVDLEAVAAQVADELAAEHPDTTLIVKDLPTVMISPARARQLLTNLMRNAVIHSGRPDVTVSVTSVPATEPGHDCVAIRDDGQGIPPADRQRVFGIFEQLAAQDGVRGQDRRRPSTGIGLTISRKIVERAGGKIWFADVDTGAEVRVSLPSALPMNTRALGETTP